MTSFSYFDDYCVTFPTALDTKRLVVVVVVVVIVVVVVVVVVGASIRNR